MSYFKGKIDYETIIKAKNGDIDSINKIMDFYSNYINHLSLKECRNVNGQSCYIVDQYIRQRLQTKLITSILNFKMK